MRVKVRRVGNSLTVTIPKEMAMEFDLGPGTEMDVTAREGALVLEPVGSRWERLVHEVRRQARERQLTERDIERALTEVRERES